LTIGRAYSLYEAAPIVAKCFVRNQHQPRVTWLVKVSTQLFKAEQFLPKS